MTDKKTATEVIAAVMNDVQGIGKNDRNSAQGFNFRGIDAVILNAVGPSLRKHGGFIVPKVKSVEYDTATSNKGGTLNIARVTVDYLVHGQNGFPLKGSACAEAFDSGDKATAKAMSVAYRTFLLQLLCLPTDEPDPDSFSYEATATPKAKTKTPDWTALLDKATTKDELRELYKEAVQGGATQRIKDAISTKANAL